RGRRSLWRGACATSRRRTFLFLWRACADVRKVLPHAHLPEKNRSFENVIARRAAAVTPFPLDIVSRVFRADLLTVAINATVRSVNARALLDHSRLRHWINICAFLIGLRIKMSDLPIGDHR